jgi:tetratricopeptide (TPR) repeat protein
VKNAKSYFEKGLSVDNHRNYKCLWGIGNIHMKQEKYQDALKYFLTAKKIN